MSSLYYFYFYYLKVKNFRKNTIPFIYFPIEYVISIGFSYVLCKLQNNCQLAMRIDKAAYLIFCGEWKVVVTMEKLNHTRKL